ncbi:hypothetical protein [Thiothrix winogradskyi]|uniref:Uncharacterized protein n=1 Tax=Thiothrix winogradskyi TaxID=96472 RepID=A0ABY3T555_9GAMM|nr:hypothetical protein [Thiothrix winogradskyi]UJS26045.1 hypothetical protein L2Y54_08400 [Thiothrix winogradskyi]
MTKPLNQLDLFALPTVAPVAPEPTISGLHWYKPDGSPLIVRVPVATRSRTTPPSMNFKAWCGQGVGVCRG